MTDPKLPHGRLPPIPDGCGVMPIADLYLLVTTFLGRWLDDEGERTGETRR